MWYFYFILALFFIFLSQLSGLPQAMFYHLHWAVALPMAFMGFLILVPGLLREVIMFLIWPIFRPFIQLLIEAVGFVNAEDDATPSKTEVHPTFVETIISFFGLSTDSKRPIHLSHESTDTNVTESRSLRHSPHHSARHSPRYSPRHSPRPKTPSSRPKTPSSRQSPRLSPRQSPQRALSSSPRQSPHASPSPLVQRSRLSTLRSSAHSLPHRSPNRNPGETPQSTPGHSPRHSRKNSTVIPAPREKFGFCYGSFRPSTAMEQRSNSQLGSNSSLDGDGLANTRRRRTRTLSSSSSSAMEEDEAQRRARVEEKRRMRMEEQYERAIAVLTPVIREHVKKYKSASPEERQAAKLRVRIESESSRDSARVASRVTSPEKQERIVDKSNSKIETANSDSSKENENEIGKPMTGIEIIRQNRNRRSGSTDKIPIEKARSASPQRQIIEDAKPDDGKSVTTPTDGRTRGRADGPTEYTAATATITTLSELVTETTTPQAEMEWIPESETNRKSKRETDNVVAA